MKGQTEELLPADINRYPGLFTAEAVACGSNPTQETSCRFNRLVEWIEDHKFAMPRKEGWFDVLLYQARLHVCHARVTDYWHDWQAEREKHPTERYPAFKESHGAIDGYTFKIGDYWKCSTVLRGILKFRPGHNFGRVTARILFVTAYSRLYVKVNYRVSRQSATQWDYFRLGDDPEVRNL